MKHVFIIGFTAVAWYYSMSFLVPFLFDHPFKGDLGDWMVGGFGMILFYFIEYWLPAIRKYGELDPTRKDKDNG